MKPKVLALVIVVVLVAIGVGLKLVDKVDKNDKNDKNENKPVISAELAGEVGLTLTGGEKALQTDKVPPDFFMVKDGQETIALSELNGKYVFMNFWTTWCHYCREEMPDLNKLYLEFNEKNVEFIFINATTQEKNIDDVITYLKESNYSMPVYLDRKGEVTKAYGVPGFPFTVVLNPEGQVIYARGGPISYAQAKELLSQ